MAGGIRKTPAGNWRAYWREPSGRQTSKTFSTKREATVFLAQISAAASTGAYVSPHAGRVLFRDHAGQWIESWNNEKTTHARDASIMRTHVLPHWGTWQLAKIDHLSVQTWITELSRRLSPATVAECRRLTSAVLRSAVRNRLIAFNPCEDIKVQKRRRRDTDGGFPWAQRRDGRQRALRIGRVDCRSSTAPRSDNGCCPPFQSGTAASSA